VTGSCLCGVVAFAIDGPTTPIEFCHCPRCRKACGSAFAATFYVPATALRWTRGEGEVATYEAPLRGRPPAYRHVFCRRCGATLPIVDRELGYAEVPAGLLDEDPGCQPLRHVFAGRKAPWFEITDSLPAHDAHVPPSDHLLAGLLRQSGS
jgi:hypothetical protein